MSTVTVDGPARTVTPVRRSWFSDVGLVMSRELRPVVREPFSVVFGLIQPLVFLGLFGPLLAGSVGAAGGFSGAEVWQWFVPAILVMTTLFGTSTTGSNLQFEMQTGAHERCWSRRCRGRRSWSGARSRRSSRSSRRRSSWCW